ncbi:MAG: PDGLE domain-containing protein [bacterium]
MKDTKWIWIGLIIALVVGGLLSIFASPSPDGLERVAEDKGFIERAAEKPLVKSPIPDYLIPGISSERLATALAGIVGTLIIFGLGYGMGRIWRKRG